MSNQFDRNKKTRKRETKDLDKKVIVMVTLAAASFFGLITAFHLSYNYFYGPDPSVDLQAVKQEILLKPHHMPQVSSSAKAVIVDFMDPECVVCRSVFWDLKKLEREYGEKINIVYRYLPTHGDSRLAISLLEESKEFGLYEKFLEILFQNQQLWGSHTNPKPELMFKYLSELGIDTNKLDQEKILQKQKWKIDLDEKDAHFLGVRKSHTLFINGKLITLFDYDSLKRGVQLAVKK